MSVSFESSDVVYFRIKRWDSTVCPVAHIDISIRVNGDIRRVVKLFASRAITAIFGILSAVFQALPRIPKIAVYSTMVESLYVVSKRRLLNFRC